MTAKDFLMRARRIDRRIDETRERLQRLRARLEGGRLTRSPDGLPRGGAGDWTENVDQVIALEQRLEAQILEMCAIKQSTMDAIDSIDDALLREVLELYYLDGLTWAQVARKMNYSVRNVTYLHEVALRRMRMLEELRAD